jgi:hypothetical protein
MARVFLFHVGIGDSGIASWAGVGLGIALIGLGRRAEARRSLLGVLDLLVSAPDPLPSDVGSTISALSFAAEADKALDAAHLLGCASTLGDGTETELASIVRFHADAFARRLVAATGDDVWAAELAVGRGMSLEAAVGTARSLDDGA